VSQVEVCSTPVHFTRHNPTAANIAGANVQSFVFSSTTSATTGTATATKKIIENYLKSVCK